MKLFSTRINLAVAGLVAAGAVALLSGVGQALPNCYAGGADTTQTPVFNNICDVAQPVGSSEGSYPLGNERDFVRIRPNITNGTDITYAKNPKLTNSLASACNNGDRFDIWTYVHNDASTDFNDNGNGTAVAKNVKLALEAKGINTTDSSFNFGSTISASNAETVSDTAVLNCNGKKVKLTLVGNSVQYNNHTTSASGPAQYVSLGDAAVNGTTVLGNPTFGSGNVYGCYDYRTVIIYEVKVEEVPVEQPSTVQCVIRPEDFVFDENTRKVTVTITDTVKNATVTGYKIDWGDNTTPSTKKSDSHTYADNIASATVTASFTAKLANGQTQEVSGENCAKPVPFKTKPTTPTTPTTTPTTPVAVTKPKVLANTGAGSTIALFAAFSAVATVAYRFVLARRLSA